jgi:hypothetical protein
MEDSEKGGKYLAWKVFNELSQKVDRIVDVVAAGCPPGMGLDCNPEHEDCENCKRQYIEEGILR